MYKWGVLGVCMTLASCTSFPIRSPLDRSLLEPERVEDICHIALPKFGRAINREICEKDAMYTVGWRYRPSSDPAKQMTPPRKSRIFILEINDQGIIVNKDVAQAAIAYTKQQMQQPAKPLVNLFVHGWNNNAEADNHDLIKFERLTVGLSESQVQSKAEVIGIFVSWRGKTLPAGLSHALTFWDRKAVSEEVGRGELTNFIFDMEAVLKPHLHDNVQTTLFGKEQTIKQNGTFMLIGHSFGGSALFNSVGHTLIARFYDSLQQQKIDPTREIRGVGDMVLLLNPAIQALRFRSLRESVYEKAAEYKHPSDGSESQNIFRNNKAPIFVVLASEEDFPVKTAFPIGRSLGQLLDFSFDATMPVYQGIQGKPIQASLKEAEKHSIGFYPHYYTHFILNTDPLKENKESLSSALWQTPKAMLEKPKEVLNDPKAILSTSKALMATPKALSEKFKIKDKDEPLNMAACFSQVIQDRLKLKLEQEVDWLNEVYEDESLQNTQNFYTEVRTNASEQRTDLFNFRIFNNPSLLSPEVAKVWPLIQEQRLRNQEHGDSLTWKRNPYWFVKANANFMSGHNGIWDNNVTCLVLALMTTESINRESFYEDVHTIEENEAQTEDQPTSEPIVENNELQDDAAILSN